MPTRSAALAGGLLVSLPLLLSSTVRARAAAVAARDASATSSATTPTARMTGAPRYEEPDDRRRQHGAAASPRCAPAPQQAGRRLLAAHTRSPQAAGRRRLSPAAARPGLRAARPIEAYSPPRPGYVERPYPPPPAAAYSSQPYGEPYRRPRPALLAAPGQPYGRPYTPPPEAYDDPRDRRYGAADLTAATSATSRVPARYDEPTDGSYSTREILDAGHGFFGTVSKGLASVVEYVFQKQGRPNGYILGQDAGGAFVAGLRYGEGILYTKDAGSRRVYWQGPSIGYDAGAEGSKVMMLVYNLRDPEEIYQRFGGVDGSAYLVGGVGVTFQKSEPCRHGADPLRRRPAARRQHRLSQVHALADLEPVLRRHRLCWAADP